MRSHFRSRLPVRALALLALSLAVAAGAAAPSQPAQTAKPAQPTKPAKPMNPVKPDRTGGFAKPGKPAKPSRSPRPAKPLPNPTKPPQPLAASAELPPLAAAPELTPAQHAVASRVLVGAMGCEFGQTVELAPLLEQPGRFTLRRGTVSYALTPQETTTGAVRLEDANVGVVWLQIPAKSMLLDARLGQRLVDNCRHEAQRSAVVAAGSSLGIADVPPLSDPWSGAADAAPLPALVFEQLPAWVAASCCQPAPAASPAGGVPVAVAPLARAPVAVAPLAVAPLAVAPLAVAPITSEKRAQ